MGRFVIVAVVAAAVFAGGCGGDSTAATTPTTTTVRGPSSGDLAACATFAAEGTEGATMFAEIDSTGSASGYELAVVATAYRDSAGSALDRAEHPELIGMLGDVQAEMVRVWNSSESLAEQIGDLFEAMEGVEAIEAWCET